MSIGFSLSHSGRTVGALPRSNRLKHWLRAAGDWLAFHQRTIRGMQWAIVGLYVFLVAVPAFLPLPGRTAHIWNNLTVFAQFAFWGIWWPFVLISMVVFGRVWCGLLCPEGTLTEFTSKYGRGYAIPRWITWGGWPFVAFALLTIYGQMVSVYQYPGAVLVVLGGSTVMAIVVGYLYGRNKRVWCRYLCPVSGVFGLLAKLAPFYFHVDRESWRDFQRANGPIRPVNCAPLVPLGNMRGASACHMCGRCSGLRGAIALAPRSPSHAIVHGTSDQPKMAETLLIVFGLIGIAIGAFQWSASPWFVSVKQLFAEWLVDRGVMWPLEHSAPWWLLTNYPDQNDVLTLLDGVLLVGYILATALLLGGGVSLLLALATRGVGYWSWRRFHHFAQTLIPLAGCGVFLGLSALTVTLLRTQEGIMVPWVGPARALLLAAAAVWSISLAWRVAGLSSHGLKQGVATGCVALAAAMIVGAWALLFWVW